MTGDELSLLHVTRNKD